MQFWLVFELASTCYFSYSLAIEEVFGEEQGQKQGNAKLFELF